MQELAVPQQIARMDQDRLRAYRENLDFYNGRQWPGATRRPERRLTFNYTRAFIDKMVSYLIGSVSLSMEPWDSSPGAEARARQAQEALRQVSLDNNLEQLDFDTELDAAILGDGCYKVIWDVAGAKVKVTAPDVQGLFAWWVGDDFSSVWRVASRYSLSAEAAEELYGVAPSGVNRKDAPVAMTEVWSSEHLQLWMEETLLEEWSNPYGFIPFILFPNLREPKRFWGLSDLPPLIEPQRELNRAMSQLSIILELSGNPIAVLEGVEQAQDIAVQPGAVWELPERARAYVLDLLQGGGIKLHVDYIDLLYRALHDLSEAPRTAFGDNSRNLSGVALEMEMHPLLQRVRRKRLIRTAVYRQRAEIALRILEQRTGITYLPVRIRVVWGQVLPQDRSRQVREERLLVEAGLHSRRRAMVNLGVEDPDREVEQIQAEGAWPAATGSNGLTPGGVEGEL